MIDHTNRLASNNLFMKKLIKFSIPNLEYFILIKIS